MRLSRNITKCGVSMHPSHAQIAPLAGYDEKEMISAVTVPQLLMPTSNDPGKFSKISVAVSQRSMLSSSKIQSNFENAKKTRIEKEVIMIKF